MKGYNFYEKISQNNILTHAEEQVMNQMSFLISKGNNCYVLYKMLVKDIRNKNNINHSFSIAYDIVQDIAIELLKYVGHKMNDVIETSKTGKKITIALKMNRTITKLIWQENHQYEIRERYNKCEDSQEYDDSRYNKFIKKMNLTKRMIKILNYRLTGYGQCKIAKILGISASLVWRDMDKMRKRYYEIMK